MAWKVTENSRAIESKNGSCTHNRPHGRAMGKQEEEVRSEFLNESQDALRND